MSENQSGTPRVKWPRSQRFQLSPAGHEAGANYRAGIVAARTDDDAGRKSFDAAGSEWAARLSLEPSDGLYFGELQNGPKTIQEMAISLDGCGPAPADVKKAVERLVKMGMLDLIIPPPPPLPAPRRW